MTSSERNQSRTGSASWVRVTAQWLAVIGPPLATFAQQQLSYSLVSPSCARRAPILLHLPTLIMLALIGVATLYSWREWARDDGEPVPTRFFPLLGLTMSGISAVVLVAQWLPTFFLPPCFQ